MSGSRPYEYELSEVKILLNSIVKNIDSLKKAVDGVESKLEQEFNALHNKLDQTNKNTTKYLSELSKKLEEKFSEIRTEISNAVSQINAQINSQISELSKALSIKLDNINENLSRISENLGMISDNLGKMIKKLSENIGEKLEKARDSIVTSVIYRSLWLDDRSEERYKELTRSIADCRSYIELVLKEFNDQQSILTSIVSKTEEFTPKLDSLKGELMKSLFEELNKIERSIDEANKAVDKSLADIRENLEKAQDRLSSLQEYSTFLSDEERVLLTEYFERMNANTLAIEGHLKELISYIVSGRGGLIER